MSTRYQVNSADVPAFNQFMAKLSTNLRAKPDRYRIEVTKPIKKNQETDAMRGYYHAEMVEKFRDFIQEQDDPVSHAQVHEDLKRRFRKMVPVVDILTGVVVGERMQRGGEMDRFEWWVFIQLVIQFLEQQVGLTIAPPRNYFDPPEPVQEAA